MKQNLLVYLNDLTKLTESLKAGVKITPELLEKHTLLIDNIQKTKDSSAIPVLIHSFVNREDASSLNWDIFVSLASFDKRELERNALEGLHSNNPGSRLWSIIILRKYINYNVFKNIYNDKFVKMLKDPESSIRYEALISLALCSHEPQKLLNQDILEDPSHKVKTFANILYQDRIEALHTVLSEIIPLNMEKIKQSVNGKPIDDAEEILKVLGALRSVKSIPYFLNAYLPYDDDGLGLNKLIEELLENFTDEELIPYLLHALEEGNLGSKAISLLMLGCIRNPLFIPNIKQFLVHENEEIRIKALEALSIMDDRSVKPDVVYVMKHDLSPRVREEAKITLELLSQDRK